MKLQSIPLLEYDDCPQGVIRAEKPVPSLHVPPYCVITFFGEILEEKYRKGELKKVAALTLEFQENPVYVTKVKGQEVGLVMATVGAPNAAGQLEELTAMGFKKFLVCGGAGVLQREIAVGHLIIPDSAIRDEGTSSHYLARSREVPSNPHAVTILEQGPKQRDIPYLKAKTWTTDAIYRETRDKIALRVQEGCVTVEMEASAFFAVAQFLGVTLGQILYGGDDLSGTEWDGRKWISRRDVRENLVELCLELCLEL